MLYDFLNCPACIDIKQTLHYKVAIERSFYAFFLMFVSHFLVVVLGRLFFVRKTKKRLLAALDRWLSYTVTIVGEFAWTDSALVVFDKRWSFEQVWL